LQIKDTSLVTEKIKIYKEYKKLVQGIILFKDISEVWVDNIYISQARESGCYTKLKAISDSLDDTYKVKRYIYRIYVSLEPRKSRKHFVVLGLIDTYGNMIEVVRADSYLDCPICLSGLTKILTKNGELEINKIQRGDTVYTVDSLGMKKQCVVVKTAKTKVYSHQVIHLKLENGNEVFASPGHPLENGIMIGKLKPGDIVGNSKVVSANLLPYKEEYTYDILLSGSKPYFANGILLRSTISDYAY